MSDILIVHQFENMIINVFGMHFDFIILHVSTIMEVPLLGVQIGPCLKWDDAECKHARRFFVAKFMYTTWKG